MSLRSGVSIGMVESAIVIITCKPSRLTTEQRVSLSNRNATAPRSAAPPLSPFYIKQQQSGSKRCFCRACSSQNPALSGGIRAARRQESQEPPLELRRRTNPPPTRALQPMVRTPHLNENRDGIPAVRTACQNSPRPPQQRLPRAQPKRVNPILMHQRDNLHPQAPPRQFRMIPTHPRRTCKTVPRTSTTQSGSGSTARLSTRSCSKVRPSRRRRHAILFFCALAPRGVCRLFSSAPGPPQ